MEPAGQRTGFSLSVQKSISFLSMAVLLLNCNAVVHGLAEKLQMGVG